jgi:hypothetical protein
LVCDHHARAGESVKKAVRTAALGFNQVVARNRKRVRDFIQVVARKGFLDFIYMMASA